MRKSKKDLLEIGLKLLGEVGIQGLTIEKLTNEAGVTKGSFYHHFQNVEDFHYQLIFNWEDQYSSTAMNLPTSKEELMHLLDKIIEEGFAVITEPEIAIRVWALHDDKVRSIVERVDRMRRQFVLEVFSSTTSDPDLANLMADMLSAILIGSMTTVPRMPAKRVLELYKEFKRVYKLSTP